VKTIPSDLLTELQAGVARSAFGIIIEREDGTQLRLTGAHQDATITGVPVNGSATGALVYSATAGLSVSNIRSAEGFAVDNLEGTLLEGGVVTRADVLRGLWDGAAWTLFRYNWADPSDGIEVLKCGRIGNIRPRTGHFVVEFRDLRQALQSEYAVVTQADCRNELGDARCGVNLASHTHTGTVTGAASAQVFTDTSRTQTGDYFGNGYVTWLTGPNAGITVKVKSYDGATDTFTLVRAMLSAIGVGDTYSAIRGCRKRRTEDCAGVFSNVANFDGEPDKAKVNDIVAGVEP
jgi:uncharacterized phage protein (TIGR02218 family)